MNFLLPVTLRRLTISAARTCAVFALLASLACTNSPPAWKAVVHGTGAIMKKHM